jgi:hypothetical protein
MTQVASRYSTMILIGAALLCILTLAGSGWWLWNNYQSFTRADPSQVKTAREELNVDQLNEAVKLVGG